MNIINIETPSPAGGNPFHSVFFSNVEGGYGGAGNINEDPMYADPENNNLGLKIDSPSIDTGTDDGAPADDILGVERPIGDGFDMGAYESMCAGNCGEPSPPRDSSVCGPRGCPGSDGNGGLIGGL